MRNKKVAIAGAGLIGQLMAWRLALGGHSVTLYERAASVQESCSWAGAGMLTPFAELEKAEPVIAAMGIASLSLWQAWLPQLARDVYFRKQGSLVVAHRQDMHDLQAFTAQVRRKLAYIEQGASAMQALDRAGLSQLEPALCERFDRALFFAEEGHLDPRQLLPALQATLNAMQIQIRFQTTVVACEPHRLVTEQGAEAFDWVIDTRGLGARQQQPQLRGVRGELLRLFAPEVTLTRPIRLMHPRYPLYIAPRPEGYFLVGATSIESDDTQALTVKSALELLSAAYSLDSGFAEARVVEAQVDCRPAYPSNNPALFCQQGLLSINGLYRHGFLVAPAVVTDALQLLTDQQLQFPELHQKEAPA